MPLEKLLMAHTFSLEANADLSASQYCAVTAVNASGVARAALPAAGGRIIGVLQNKPNAAGEPASIAAAPATTPGVSAAAFTAADNLMVDAAGKFLLATSTNAIVAVAMESAGGANQVVSVMLLPGAALVP